MRALVVFSLVVSSLFLQGCGGESDSPVDGGGDDGSYWGNWLFEDASVPRDSTVFIDVADGKWVINLFNPSQSIQFSTSFVVREGINGELDYFFSNGSNSFLLEDVVYSFNHPIFRSANIVFAEYVITDNLYLEGTIDLMLDEGLTHFEIRAEKVSDSLQVSQGRFNVSYDDIQTSNTQLITSEIVQDTHSIIPELSVVVRSHDVLEGDSITLRFTEALPLDPGVYDVETLWERGSISEFEVYSPAFGAVEVLEGSLNVQRSSRYELDFQLTGETFDFVPVRVNVDTSLIGYLFLR